MRGVTSAVIHVGVRVNEVKIFTIVMTACCHVLW